MLGLLGTPPRDEIWIDQMKKLRESALVVQFKAHEVLRLVGGP